MLGVQCDLAVGLNDLTDQQGHNGGDDALGSAELQGNRHSREDGEGQRDTGRDLAQAAQEVDRQQVEQVDDHLQAEQQGHAVHSADDARSDHALFGVRAPGADDVGGEQDAVDQDDACGNGRGQAVADDQTKADGKAGGCQSLAVHALFQILWQDRAQAVVEHGDALVCQDRCQRTNCRDDNVAQNGFHM